MPRIFWAAWDAVEQLGFFTRFCVKTGIGIIAIFFVLYPNPILFFKQLSHYRHPETLIQQDFPALKTINHEIDAMLPESADAQQEFAVVQQFVYGHIRYEYDWDNWGNLDFWPTAEQVWERQREDCDGQAVLAVSILRSRGFKTARLMGNFRHIWVAVEDNELMEPDTEQNLRFEGGKEGGKLAISLPSFRLLGESMKYFSVFPAIRSLTLFLLLLGLCYHPSTDVPRFFQIATLGLIGFILLKDWSQKLMNNGGYAPDLNCMLGAVCIGIALLAAIFLPRRKHHQSVHAS